MMFLLIGVGVSVGIIALVVVVGFNRLRRADIAAEEAIGGIDVQLTRRSDLIPNLIETVRGYAGHEKTVLEEITRARARVQQATTGDDVKFKAASDAALEQSLLNLNAVAENYPDLKASSNFVELQKELADTESQISFARAYYNDAVRHLNNLTQTIPWMFFTGLAGVPKRDFYEAPEGHREVPRVQF